MTCPKLISVLASQDHRLHLQYENGEKRVYDVKPLLARRPWRKLTDMAFFQKAAIFAGTVVWDMDTDIAPENLYTDSIIEST